MAPPKFKPVTSFVTWAKILNLPHFSFPKSKKQGPERLPSGWSFTDQGQDEISKLKEFSGNDGFHVMPDTQ